jgi:hypothetical protein
MKIGTPFANSFVSVGLCRGKSDEVRLMTLNWPKKVREVLVWWYGWPIVAVGWVR